MISLSLDPSVNHVGWSTFNNRALTRKRAWKWGTIELEGRNFEARCMHLIHEIQGELPPFDFLITEKPAFYSSERGKIAARMNYTIDLAAVAFYVAGWFHMDHRHHFAITATTWKGSVSKEITARKFFKNFPGVKPSTLDEHAIDAVMLHRYWLQYLAVQHREFVQGSELLRLPQLV
jgi:hypothetical protein